MTYIVMITDTHPEAIRLGNRTRPFGIRGDYQNRADAERRANELNQVAPDSVHTWVQEVAS